jgi:acyl-CoA thioesterase
MPSTALFQYHDGTYMPSQSAGSPWSPELLHGGPPTGLLAHCLEAVADTTRMRLARLSSDLLRPVPRAPLRVETSIVRSGRRLQLLTGTLLSGEQPVCRCTALYLERRETTVPDYGRFPKDTLPAANNAPIGTLSEVAGWSRDFSPPGLHTTAEARLIDGVEGRGRGRVWMRLPVPVVDGEPTSPAVQVATLADFGNGVAQLRLDPETGSINTDVNLHLHRVPTGEWVGFDARSRMEADGVGLAETVLYDDRGPIGRVTQSLMAMPLYSG